MADIDWNAEWRREQASRRAPDSAEYWDRRAPSFQKAAGTSPYARTFMERAAVLAGETVFDMGCGSGTLAVPYAAAGHEVWAADFSQAMLDLMMQRAEAEGVAERIHPVCLAWDDSWRDAPMPVCDVALASRSMAVADLHDALVKLASMSRRRVCLTLGTNESPRCDDVLTAVLGREKPARPDFVYAMNILWDMGLMPSLSYIASKRIDSFDTPAEAVEKFALIYHATPGERERLERYADEHLKRQPDGTWAFDHERITRWAFISWDK